MASSGVVTMTCPTFTGTGLVNYALNAPAVGATFPLAVDAVSLTTGTVAAARLPQVSTSSQGAFPSLTSSLDDATATQLGLKQYLHGTTYNGGIAPTVTSALSGFTVARCSFIPYQAQDGAWRLKFNIAGTYTLSTVSSTTITVNGITFKNVSNYSQAISVFINSSGLFNSTVSYTNANASTIQITSSATATSNTISVSSDVELNGKPTWAY
jgi:hypothetical protein